jgi:hypothetical protein
MLLHPPWRKSHCPTLLLLFFIFALMARKIFIVYLVYTVILFLFYNYIMKADYADAILKAVLSGVVFTAVYTILLSRAAKREDEKNNKKKK